MHIEKSPGHGNGPKTNEPQRHNNQSEEPKKSLLLRLAEKQGKKRGPKTTTPRSENGNGKGEKTKNENDAGKDGVKKDDLKTSNEAVARLLKAEEEGGNAEEAIIVEIMKVKPTLGISISGGKDSPLQPNVKVEKIYAGGAAADCRQLKVRLIRSSYC